MTTVVATQPMFFPWAGLISQIAMADTLIWLDDAQFTRNSFTHRVQIKSAGKQRWLTIPLKHTGSRQAILALASSSENWPEQQVREFSEAARRSPYLDEALRLLSSSDPFGSICDQIIRSAQHCCNAISGTQNVVRELQSSKMEVPGTGWRRILDLVHAVGGTRYITGHGAANYLDHLAFEAEGVSVEYMGYDFLTWPQQHGDFSPFVTSLDLIANVSPDQRHRHLSTRTIPWRRFLAKRGLPITG